MPAHVDNLTSNVTVTVQRSTAAFPALPLAAATVGATTLPTTEDLPPSGPEPTRVVTLPDSGRKLASTGIATHATMGDDAKPLTAGVDLRALEERVVRLWREELRIARERE